MNITVTYENFKRMEEENEDLQKNLGQCQFSLTEAETMVELCTDFIQRYGYRGEFEAFIRLKLAAGKTVLAYSIFQALTDKLDVPIVPALIIDNQ